MSTFKYTLFLVFILIFVCCSNRNDFKYKGEIPGWNYMNMPSFNEDLESLYTNADEDEVALRNRIYITIDSSLNLFLNGHQINTEEFERDFRFVYTNTKNLSHLPESSENAVVYYAMDVKLSNLNKAFRRSLAFKKKQLEISEMQLKIQRVINELQEEYASVTYKVSIDKLDSIQQIYINQKYPLNYKFYSPIFGDIEEDKGILAKLETRQPSKSSLLERNIIKVEVRQKKQVFFNGKPIEINQIKDRVITLVSNKNKNVYYPDNPKNAIISLGNEKNVDYKIYLKVYNGILEAYQEMWNQKSQELYGKSFDKTNRNERRKIKSELPLSLSEAEPTDFK